MSIFSVASISWIREEDIDHDLARCATEENRKKKTRTSVALAVFWFFVSETSKMRVIDKHKLETAEG